MFGLSLGLSILLVVCVLAACVFELINGFHDTANAVATVIYTKSLKPTTAVVISGILNFLGVLIGGTAVAMGIVNMLPLDALIDQNISHGVAMISAIILTAIIWNLGTWYFGIPSSSSHTLIGSIFGVGLAYSLIPGVAHVALNWSKINGIGLSLLISPVFGFGMALLLMYLLKRFVKKKKLFKEPKDKKPPFWIRSILILSSGCISLAHGSNDGQKGVGLIMIILILLVPTHFAVDKEKNPQLLLSNANTIELYLNKIDTTKLNKTDYAAYSVIKKEVKDLQVTLAGKTIFSQIQNEKFFSLRKEILTISSKSKTIFESKNSSKIANFSSKEMKILNGEIDTMKTFTEYSPNWVILMISISLGLGTMIGWKRIVVTLGEKIGKTNMNYAQGVSAQITAASTIGLSTWFGLPVSTTHVLSSGIAGTMVAHGGTTNLQSKTLKNIVLAWVITLPFTIIVSGLLFLGMRYLLN